VARFELLSWPLPGESEKTTKHPELGQLVSRPRSEPGTQNKRGMMLTTRPRDPI
jgi:hypothetical protein